MADILVVNGDVIWDNGDIAFVTGEEDIKQQAYLRSIADEGESVFYPSYGSKIFMYLGRSESKAVKSYIESAAREALLKVVGISEVLNVELREICKDGEPINYYVLAKFKTENGQTLDGEYIFNI